jgi:hypothetical protein
MPIIHDQEATSGRELTNPGSSLNCDPRSWDINTSAPLPHGHNSWKIRVLHWLSEFLSKVKLKSPRVIDSGKATLLCISYLFPYISLKTKSYLHSNPCISVLLGEHQLNPSSNRGLQLYSLTISVFLKTFWKTT